MFSFCTNLDLFVILQSGSPSFNDGVLFEAVGVQLGSSLSEEDSVTLKEFCRRFTRSAEWRWKKCKRNTKDFRKNYENWLQKDVDWPSCVQTNLLMPELQEESTCLEYSATSTSTELTSPECSSSSSSIGTMTKRPRKAFEDLSNKQKKRRSDSHNGENSTELAFTAAQLLKEDGRDDIASVIEHMLKNPEIATNICRMIKKPNCSAVFTPEKALGLFISLKLSKWQYITLRETAIREGAQKLYPSYYKIQQAKLQCYPPKSTITITDSLAEIKLQALLDLTTKRILDGLSSNVENKQLTLISKWGFDGASSQSRYKQKMEGEQDDSSIFMTSLVPLKLVSGEDIVWTNPKPCSPSYCRPLMFRFVKESEAVVLEQKGKIEEEIKALLPTEYNTCKIHHALKMTMIDGKICTYLSAARSNATCYLCLAKPTEMNRINSVTSKTIATELYEFGLSPLHARINSMECLLHISYRLVFKKWAAKGDEHKKIMNETKKTIQDRFKEELNLLIDIVKQGSGTTNDGNTARRFFQNPEKTAAITGLNEELVRRFAVILQAITSGEHVAVSNFREYALETAKKYVELYDWYYMPSTVHKLLIHGADIIASNAIVPIGSLSEEASEARNKDFRMFREHNSRKKSRQASNEDILNMLILSSDPLITAMRPTLDAKKKQAFFIETIDLLKLEEPQIEVLGACDAEPDSELDSEDSDLEE